MTKRDFVNAIIIGCMVGLLSQQVLTNILPDIQSKFSISAFALRAGIFLIMALGAPAALFLLSFASKWAPILLQLGKFACVGVSNAFMDLGVLNGIIYLTGIAAGPWYPVFKTISFIFATTNSFLWNRNWTFQEGKHTDSVAREAVQFYMITLVSWLVNVSAASYIVNYVSHGGISQNLWANIGAIGGVIAAMTLNFLGYKLFVFKKKEPLPQALTRPPGSSL